MERQNDQSSTNQDSFDGGEPPTFIQQIPEVVKLIMASFFVAIILHNFFKEKKKRPPTTSSSSWSGSSSRVLLHDTTTASGGDDAGYNKYNNHTNPTTTPTTSIAQSSQTSRPNSLLQLARNNNIPLSNLCHTLQRYLNQQQYHLSSSYITHAPIVGTGEYCYKHYSCESD